MLKILIKDIFNDQYFAVLSSEENGQPYCNLVAFAVTENLRALIFVTGRNTLKYRNIANNQRVSLLIDSRTNNPADIEKAIAITVIGTAHEATGEERGFDVVFLNKHPHLRQFVTNPDNALVVVSVVAFVIAGFDNTQRIIIDENAAS
jgi:heme iron utilization protein